MPGTRDSILKSAIELFAHRGYSGTSTRAICEATGITKPVLYYHFRSKGHLYEELMIDSFSYYLKTLLSALNTKGPLRQRLVRMVYSDFRSAKNDPIRIQFIFRMIFSPEEHPYFNYVEEMERQRKVITSTLQEAINEGQIGGNASDLATALMGMQLIAILEHLLTGRRTLTRRNAEKYVDILLQGASIR